LTFTTESYEFKQVSVYPEATFFGKALFQAFKIMPGKVDHCSAAGTYEVMVVLLRTHSVTAAASSGMHFADKAKFGKDFQCAVNGHQSGTGIYIAYLFIDIVGSKVIG
jgi:hypothetical protein